MAVIIKNIDEILTELGWQDGFRIPVANEENKQLEEEIEKKLKLKANLSAKLESMEERSKMMQKHIHNLIVEQDMNQNIITTQSIQLESEDHSYRLSCNTESNFRQKARFFEKEWKSVNEVVSNIERDLEKIMKKIETSKKAIKYEEKGLRELEELLGQNEDNNQLIEQYIKEDLKEYKELELKRQKLSAELQTYRDTIVKITNEAQEVEIILSRTSALYDQALAEYQQMFNQWRDSVTMLQQRNNDIKKTIQEIETLHKITKDKQRALEESEQFLKEQNENNKQIEDSIKKLEKTLFQMKEEQHKLKEVFSTYGNQLIIYKNNLKELTQRMQQMQSDLRHKELQIQAQYEKLEKANKQVCDLTAKLHDIDNQKLDIEGKAKEVENMIMEQEKKKSKIMKEISRLQAANLHVVDQIKDLENQNKIMKIEYQQKLKSFEYLGKLHTKDEQMLEEKAEILYMMEFEVQKAEMKLGRLRGQEFDKDEAERKQRKIEELQNTLNEKMKIHKLLQNQIISLEDEMRHVSNNLTNDNNELKSLKNKKQDLVLLINSGEKELKAAQNRYEEKQVEESMLRLKVSQMEKTISNLGNNVYNLERYQLELEAAVRERKAEIAIQKESLSIQKRVASNECSELRCAIAERKIRTKQLQARYDNCVALLGTNTDGTPISTTYLKIQNAQERYLLQEEGDKLDETIRKTEQEIQAMENTLRIINTCNDKYKATLKANENKSELEECQKLNEELQSVEQDLKQKKEELQFLTRNMEKLQEDYAKILKDIDEAQEQKENKTQYLNNLKQQIQEQKEKISRADRNLQNAKKGIQQMVTNTGDNSFILQEKEVQLRELQEQNSIVLQDIAEFTVQYIETESYIKKLLAAKDIELPTVPMFSQSPASSRCHSSSNSTESRPKSMGCRSVSGSSKESCIGNVVNLEPEFETASGTNLSMKSTKQKPQSVRTSLYMQSTKKSL